MKENPPVSAEHYCNLEAMAWHTKREALIAERAKLEAVVELLAAESEQAREKWDAAKDVRKAALEACDAAEGNFKSLTERGAAAKRRLMALGAELQAHEGQRPSEKEI